MLGIIGAMKQEVAKVKEAMMGVQIETVAGMEFYRGTINGKDAVVVQSGVGKVNAAVCTQILIDRFKVNGVINTGIAGSLKTEINIGDMVLSTDTVQHDVDVTQFGYEFGVVPGRKTAEYTADPKLLALAKVCCTRVNPDIQSFEGRVVSGDQFISEKEKKEWIARTFGGCCTEMEGAAIGQAAVLNGVPYLVIRAISDKADDSAVMDYDEFEEKAIRHSVNLILEIAAGY